MEEIFYNEPQTDDNEKPIDGLVFIESETSEIINWTDEEVHMF